MYVTVEDTPEYITEYSCEKTGNVASKDCAEEQISENTYDEVSQLNTVTTGRNADSEKRTHIKLVLFIVLLGCLALWLIFMLSQNKPSVPAQRMGESMNYQVASASIAHLAERYILAQDNKLILYFKDLNEEKCIRTSLL